MSLRPRYSLLTLLLLMALIAGGVKLWRGPHRVVESDGQDWEVEFIFTRDWRGNRIVEGPVIFRTMKNGPYSMFMVVYARQAVNLPWIYKCQYWSTEKKYRPDNYPHSQRTLPDSPLSQVEREEFQAVIDREKLRLSNPGPGFEFLEYHGPPLEPND